jgi:SAM-dependent methyltransferase
MSPSDAERLERERLDAERRYNAALTELDRSVVHAAAQSAPGRDDIARITTALIVFLQQITAFVETKDRELAANAARRFDAVAPSIESIEEVRAQLGVVQRTVRALAREQQERGPAPGAAHQAPGAGHQAPSTQHLAPSTQSDLVYLSFEDQFRGPADAIEERLRAYVPLFEGRSDVIDLGCGRGEFLDSLKNAGIRARGVDANKAMAAAARDRGLDAAHADALTYLSAIPDGTVGGLIATQVIEHLEPSYLMALLDTASRKLQPGAPLVLETINPACWLAFFSSYIRDFTHVRPIHPDTLQYLLRATGFERVEIRYSAPVPDQIKMKTVDPGAEIERSDAPVARALAQMAHAANANASILNSLLFSHLDYAAIGYRI